MTHKATDCNHIRVRAHYCDLVTFRSNDEVLHCRILHGSEESKQMARSVSYIEYPLDTLDGKALSVEYARERSHQVISRCSLGCTRSDRSPLCHAGKVDVVQEHNLASLILPT